QARREGPAEVASTAHVTLLRAGEIVHPAHPHAGVAGIDHDDAVIWYVPRELGADAFGADGCGVRGQRRLILRRPFLADFLRGLAPGLAFAGAGAVGRCEHTRERDLGIAVDAGEERIIAADRLRIDVDLNRRRADLGHRPEMRGHAAGLGADEADEIGAV